MKQRFGLGVVITACIAVTMGCASAAQQEIVAAAEPAEPALVSQVEILRTEYGVPHIFAENFAALGFGLAYCQVEDYGVRVVRGLVQSKGEMGLHFGPDSTESDFLARRVRRRALETYPLLSADARALMEGFAAGVNRYVQLHPEEFAEWGPLGFTGQDVHGVFILTAGSARRFLDRLHNDSALILPPADEGSNAWAFAPSRTASGKAILLRNPHLSWSAGYYEAHLVIPNLLNWYGDVRVGRPLFYIGGFNERLGWATTNNGPDLEEIYALEVDPARPDHYLFDGGSVPLIRETVTVEFKNGPGIGTATREFWTTPLGPVIERRDGKVFVLKATTDGEYRMVDQYLRMMRARSHAEWLDAMRVRAHESSNFTYADADGNIAYLWNAKLPDRPHAPAGDTAAVLARRSSDVWTDLVPFESLPQLLNPVGGYIHNENDPFYFTSLSQPFDTAGYGPNFPRPNLRLRSQLALELIQAAPEQLTLEDVVAIKHTPRMLLADRVKDELVRAVRASGPAGGIADAIALLDAWDNTASAEAQGGVLFLNWFDTYMRGDSASGQPGFGDDWNQAFAEPWRSEAPTTTPRGLSDADWAVRAFERAVRATVEEFGSWDVTWGEVHRVRHGSVDMPLSGCPGWAGCFRTLSFTEAPDGKQVANRGDAWIFAVEFGDVPRAYSVLAYGQSDREDSPHHDDQAAMFAEGRLKPVAFTREDIEQRLIRRYRPGREK
jgi:acyl-homoserine-lactone acylase